MGRDRPAVGTALSLRFGLQEQSPGLIVQVKPQCKSNGGFVSSPVREDRLEWVLGAVGCYPESRWFRPWPIGSGQARRMRPQNSSGVGLPLKGAVAAGERGNHRRARRAGSLSP